MNTLDKSFKILINKEFTTATRATYEELGSDTLNIHSREVWVSDVPTSSAAASSSGIVQYYNKFELTADSSYPANTFTFISGSDRVRGFVGDKYGSEYKVKLYDNSDNEIYETDPIDWLFDYVTGILTIDSPGAYLTPYKVSVYKYTGAILEDSLGGSGGDSVWYDGTTYISSSTDTKITGSLDVMVPLSHSNDIILIRSASFNAMKINNSGVLVIGSFDNIPTAEEGAIIYSGSNLFFGVE